MDWLIRTLAAMLTNSCILITEKSEIPVHGEKFLHTKLWNFWIELSLIIHFKSNQII